MSPCDISDVTSEAGVIASAILSPEMTFYSEQLTPHHFTNEQNGYMYYAIRELAKKGITQIDAYNITNILNARPATRGKAESLLPIPAINEFIKNAPAIARNSVEEYRMVSDRVLNAAFRRETYNKLAECQRYCLSGDENEIEQKIYSTLDDVMLGFSVTTEVPQYKDVVDKMWAEIVARQGNNAAAIPFKFPALNEYVTIESGELIIFAADTKKGKSIMLLNEAVDLLRRGLSVMYIDSELNTRMFTCRLLSHITGVNFKRIKSGDYSEEEGIKIAQAIQWLKQQKFTHLYMPIFDSKSMYTAVKTTKHTQGIDVLIVDYFKGNNDEYSMDAFATYQELGRLVDMVKNEICGKLDIAGLGAAQATSAGRIADSKKIARNASTIIMLEDKTPEEVEADGIECGNKKLRVVLNRNGAQMAPDEYIDVQFWGNQILFEEAQKQHRLQQPY